jgi:protein involved in polysaccharide export with SLBB domain
MVYEPNEYRLVEGMRVKNLIEAAGGLDKTAYLRAAELTRSHVSQDGMAMEKIAVNLEKAMAGDPEQNVVLQDYDRLTIRPIPELDFGRTAAIQGQVKFPGTYPIAKGELLSSLIERAGGYTDRAYLKGAVFTRESAKETQRDRLSKLISEIEQSMLTSAGEATGSALDAEDVKGQQAALATKRELLTKLRVAQVTGRVVVKLADLAELRGSKYDFELEDADALTIPAMPGVVHVMGEVFNPTSLQYEKDRTVSYYLRRVGGMTKDADKKQLSVIKADGSVVSIQQGNRAKLVFWDSEQKSWFFGGFMSMEMEPGDTIIVPRKMDRFFWLKTTKDLTQIVFQIAVAAGIAFAI